MTFLLPNVSKLFHPRDQVVIKTLNKQYHHRLLQSPVEVTDEGGDMLENLKKIQ